MIEIITLFLIMLAALVIGVGCALLIYGLTVAITRLFSRRQ